MPERTLAYFIIVLLFGMRLVSQTPDLKNFRTTDGLLTNEVYNLHQDKKGYLWVFSRYGTVKYNGIQFKPVLKNLSINDAFIYSIYENAKGRMWVANSNAKIYEVRNDSAYIIEGIEKISVSLKNTVSEIGKLVVDDSLNIYIGTKGSSYKLTRKNGGYVPTNLCGDLTSERILIKTLELGSDVLQLVALSKPDELKALFDSRYAYAEFSKNGNDIRIPIPTNYLKFANRVIKKFNDTIYFACHSLIYKVYNNYDNPRCVNVNNSAIVNYTRDKNNHLWVGCYNDGLYELNEKDSIVNHYFVNTTINDVLVDFQNGLWFSTPGAGLFRFQNVNFQVLKETQALESPIHFIEKRDSSLFAGNERGWVFKIEEDHVTKIRDGEGNTVLDVVKVKDIYLFSLRYGIEKYDPGKNIRKKISKLDQPTCLRFIPKSQDTLICIWRRGINFWIKGVEKKRLDLNRKILSAQLMNNLLWLGTENGVYQYKPNFSKEGKRVGKLLIPDKDSLFQASYLEPTRNSIIEKMVEDSFHNLWFCSMGNGLFKLKGSKLTQYTIKNNLPSNIINNISFTEEDNALLSCNNGLFISKWDKKDSLFKHWECIYEGEVQNALQSGNKIYVHTSAGLIVIKIENEREKLKKFYFNLASIIIDSDEIDCNTFKGMRSYQNSIEFKYDLISFTAFRSQIKYSLTGPIVESGFANNSVIKFDRLTPGNYTLIAFPEIIDGENKQITIPFSVAPAFWQTTVFQISVTILLLLFISIVIRLVVKYNQKKESVRIKNEQLISEYKLIALKAQINPHFMSNCLSAIQDLIMSDNPDKATFYVAQFGLLVRQILEYSSKQLITLKEELDLITIYMELEQLRFENKFIFKIHIEDDISTEKTYVPPLILNPIVENAIWHGLLPVQGQRRGELLILVGATEKSLVLSVKDNGKGRDLSEKVLSSNNNKSHGIKITEQRLANINFLDNHNDSRLIYTDLCDENNKPSGTKVTIYLPLNFELVEDE